MRHAGFLDLLGLTHPSVVSVVGGGGKTTLLARATDEAISRGIPLLISTSTKLQKPCPISSEQLHVGDIPSYDFMDSKRTLWVGASENTGKKWLAPAVDCLETVAREIKSARKNGRVSAFPGFLIEADGSAGRPVKAPGADEPVVLRETDTMVAVVGLSAIGRIVGLDTVHRLEPFKKIARATVGDVITLEMLFRLLTHPEGAFKGSSSNMRRVLILNQADTPERLAAADELIDRLNIRHAEFMFPDDVVAAVLEKGWMSDFR